MSFLLGGGKSQRVQPTIASGLQLQSSSYGGAVPIGYGTFRATPNLIWYGAFQAIGQSASGGGKGGAVGGGGGGKGGTATNYIYQTAVALGLIEGPINKVGNVYVDKNINTLAALNFTTFLGSYPQTAWGYLTTNFPSQALNYNGMSYVASPAYALGNSPQLPNHNFEIFGTFSLLTPQNVSNETQTIPASPYQISVEFASSFTGDIGVTDSQGVALTKILSGTPTNYQYKVSAGVYTFAAANKNLQVLISYNCSAGPDADASLILPDLLTNIHYGSQFPSSRIGNLSVWQSYIIANGLLISPYYNSQTQVSSMLTDIVTATNSQYVWSEGVLNVVPYGDKNITAYGYTYTAPSAPVAYLTDDDFMVNEGGGAVTSSTDPIIMSRKRPADQINSVKIVALDRNNQYNTATIEVKDQALIETFSLRQSSTGNSSLFCNLVNAKLSAQLQLQRQYIMNTYVFTVDQRYVVLDPMDIIAITDSNPSMGIYQQWVRINEITENTDGSLTISAEDYIPGTGNAPSYPTTTGAGHFSDYSQSAGNVNDPVIFEPPIIMAATQIEVWIAASGGPLYGGCEIWVSTDNDTYKYAGRMAGPCRQGVLSANLPLPVANPDIINTLSVDMSESQGELLSGTQGAADTYQTICYVGGELIAYETATLTGSNLYNLTYLQRGIYGTTVSAHVASEKFARLDSSIFTYSYNKQQIGTVLYIKFLTFNIWNSGQQSLSDVSPVTHLLIGPTKPGTVLNFAGQQNGNVVVFTWDDLLPNDVGLKGYDIAYADKGITDWSQFTLLTEAARGTEMTNASVPPGSWTFGIRAHDVADQLSPVISMFDLVVTNADNVITTNNYDPTWFGSLVNLFLHYTGVLTPTSTKTVDQYTVLSSPAAPTLSQVLGGVLVGATYYVKVTYTDLTGETLCSSESSLVVLTGNLLQVASPSALSGASGYNVYVSTTTGAETRQNVATVPLGASWTLPSTGLISGTSQPTSNHTGWQVFDDYVPDPVSSGYYTTFTTDTGLNDTLRVFSTESSALGPGQTGLPAQLEYLIDTWLTGASDPNVYIPWTIGFVTMRYINNRLQYNNIVDGNVSYISNFSVTIDKAPVIENSSSGGVPIIAAITTTGNTLINTPNVTGIASMTGIAVGQCIIGLNIPAGTTVLSVNVGASSLVMSANATASGTASPIEFTTWITFPQAFHFVPNIQVTPFSTTGASGAYASPSLTGFAPLIFNSSGTSIAGTVSWSAAGT